MGGEGVPGEAGEGFLRAAHSPQRVLAWRSAFFYGLLIAAVFIPFDLLYPDRLALTLGARALLVGTLATGFWLLRRPGLRRAGPVVVVGAVGASVLTPLIVFVSAGSASSRFGFVLAVPFLVLVLLPEVPGVATASGLIAAFEGAVAMAVERQRPLLVAEWALMASGITWLTSFASRRLRALADRARDAELERRVAIARLKESERRRVASERLAWVGRLAAGIGHEINNPLSAVRGNVECALEELDRLDVAPAAREALGEALAASERIGWITADMRSLTGAVEPLSECDVADAIRDALGRAAPRLRHARVLLEIEAGLPEVRSVPRLLADAIAHLAGQAAASRGPLPTVRIGARRVDGAIEIAVDDEGPPIPAHILPKVFEPFAVQGEVAGAGLGLMLPMTRELAERSGGRVEARWHERGNRFTITLAASDR